MDFISPKPFSTLQKHGSASVDVSIYLGGFIHYHAYILWWVSVLPLNFLLAIGLTLLLLTVLLLLEIMFAPK